MILCDIDGVLAVGPAGDTAPGEPIYRTSPDLAVLLEQTIASGVPFHVITAKVQPEALQVLEALGIERQVASLITADRLFWPSVWDAIRRGRMPAALSKGVCRPLLPEGSGQTVVMIENYAPHLRDMLAAGVIDFGILVPPIRIEAGRVTRTFDLAMALRLARDLVTAGPAASELAGGSVSVSRWRDGASEHLEDTALHARTVDGNLLQLPCFPPPSPLPLESLATGRTLVGARRNLVTTVRSGRRLMRRIAARLFARSV